MAIKKCHELGFKMINSPKVLMKLHRYFHENEKIPHPNITTELGRKFHSPFLDIFPEFQIKLRQWAMKNLSKLNCENVRNAINEHLLPEIYKTYLENETHDNLPSFSNFLEDFNLSTNGISHSTTWRWLLELGFEYKERKNVISHINMNRKKI